MQNTRTKVIETGVQIEESISQIISLLLDVDKDSSKSFGYKSSSLSFLSRINLLGDLKFIPKEIITDFQLFAEIRNKFAHVYHIDTFKKCFEIVSDKKNIFLKKFEGPKDLIDEESIYNTCFDILCFTLNTWLRVTFEMIKKKQTQEIKKTLAIEMIRNFIKYDKNRQNENLSCFVKNISQIIHEIELDEEFENIKIQLTQNTAAQSLPTLSNSV